MTIRHSQNDEEIYILEALTPGIYPLFLDIGAYDGVTFSNTFALVEMGWEGVLVEPALVGFSRLLERYGDNGRLQLVHAAIGVPGLVKFRNTADALSTTSEEWFQRFKAVGRYSPAIWMAQVGLSDLIEMNPQLVHVSVVSIDIEGGSAELFMHWPFHLMHPKVFCVEHDGRESDMLKLASVHGYREVYRNAENLVLSL